MEEGELKVKSGTANREAFARLVAFAEENEFALAMWRLPNTTTTHIILDTQGQLTLEDINIEELSKGFLFCPYEQGSNTFIQGDIHYSTKMDEAELSERVSSEVREALVSFTSAQAPTKRPDAPADLPADHFKEVVSEAIAEIERGSFQKVVPSRVKLVDIPEDFDVVRNFQKLAAAYPRTFVFYTSIPSIGCWMGATPETLIEIENGQLFRTVSLAGTQRYEQGTEMNAIAWTQKDIEEQAMVSRYIINCFKKIRLREFSEHGPKTAIAGNLIHLKTIFEVDMEETGFSNLGTVMLNLLHPTSAVCGLPKEEASRFLHEHEQHDRKYYSGFLGPVNNNEDTHVFVNLRSMQVFRNHALLYAGAGITEDSNPEREWLETEMKFNTLLNVIDVIKKPE